MPIAMMTSSATGIATRRNRLIAFCILLLINAAMGLLFQYGYQDFTISGSKQAERQTRFPFVERSPQRADTYQIRGQINRSILSPTSYIIAPDDRLISMTINDRKVDLSSFSPGQLADWHRGFKIDLQEYLKRGENSVSFVIADVGGLYGVRVRPALSQTDLITFRVAWGVAFIAMVWLFLSFLKLRWEINAILTLGLALRIVYTMFTDFNVRGHDTDEHLEYVFYFMDHWRLPDLASANGGAYFHPPLYYFIAGKLTKLLSILRPGEATFHYAALQYLSVAFSFGFLIYTGKIATFFFSSHHSIEQKQSFLGLKRDPRIPAALATALVAFWPSAVIHGARIGNDPLLYFSFTAALYYILKFNYQPNKKLFLYGAIMTAVAVLTKANGVLLGILGAVLIIQKGLGDRSLINAKVIKAGIVPAAIALFAVGVAFFPGAYLKAKGDRTHLYVDNINNVSGALRVDRDANNFLWMDLNTFINEAYTSPYSDDYGRQYFANYLLKTGLIGEWWHAGDLTAQCTIAISFILLIFLIVVIRSYFQSNRRHYAITQPLSLSIILLLVSVYYMRITFPVNIDFRYILPILVPFAVMLNYATVKLWHQGSIRAGNLSLCLQLLFIALSILFFIGLAIA